MNSRTEIEAAITQLSQTEADRLLDDAWDEKMKADADKERSFG